jgi:hypothetical protein
VKIVIQDPERSRDAGRTVDRDFSLKSSLTDADGTTSVFAFDTPIIGLVAAFVGGVAQIPEQCSVDAAGRLVLSDVIAKPEAPVSVLGLWSPS